MTTSGRGTTTAQWQTNNIVEVFIAGTKAKHLFPKTQQGVINTQRESKLAKTFKHIV